MTTTTTTTTETKADRIREALLWHWHRRSDREIAEQLGVSNKAVSNARNKLIREGKILPRRESTQSVKACQEELCTSAVRPVTINNLLYDEIDENDPAFLALVEDIRVNGILTRLTISADGYILSGHRRHAAATVLGLERIPVEIRWDVEYGRDRDEFLRLLASYNRQRVKTAAEQTREELALMSDKSCGEVRCFRREAANIDSGGEVELRLRKPRSAIRDKLELRSAIIKIVQDERRNWPLSDRSIHYRLLNVAGLVRNDKSRLAYRNDDKSYDDATNMLTRMRLDGSIPFECIADETRPVSLWDVHACVGDYVRRECNKFLTQYWRSLQQSQPNWVELLVEKNTVASQLREVAAKYSMPLTSGRGYSSLPPRKEMVDRWRASGRENLVVIVVADLDPEGCDIPASFGTSLRDDFDVPDYRLKVIRAALTKEQVQSFGLHAGQLSKDTSSRYHRFVADHGGRCWELEALSADQLREITEAAIRNVLDVPAFEAEVKQEQQERRELDAIRQKLRRALTTATNGAE